MEIILRELFIPSTIRACELMHEHNDAQGTSPEKARETHSTDPVQSRMLSS